MIAVLVGRLLKKLERLGSMAVQREQHGWGASEGRAVRPSGPGRSTLSRFATFSPAHMRKLR
jgi:hypothetical protein